MKYKYYYFSWGTYVTKNYLLILQHKKIELKTFKHIIY